jgi:hypothetical protein
VTSAGRTSTGVGLLAALGLLAGCGGSASGAGGEAVPKVTVRAGGDEIELKPTQDCLDGEGRRYQISPPILEVLPDTPIELSVPDAVAEAGWSVQVLDEELAETIGEVDVPTGDGEFDRINSSDVAPPAFYLVVIEDSDPDACKGLAGAWPVGFIRTDGTRESTSPAPAG